MKRAQWIVAGGLALAGLSPAVSVGSGASPAPDAVPSPVAAADGGASAPEKVTPDLAKKLLSRFKAAQASESKALEHRHKLELKELKASQAARQKEWERREKEARHQYFREHTHGPERRAYVKDFIERRRAFVLLLNDEREQRAHDQSVRAAALKSEQAQKLKEFKESLDRGETPPERLWPSAS